MRHNFNAIRIAILIYMDKFHGPGYSG
uniref:Uncharacterized protein n=1 Tax=Anguilla anguilla TaxID=7936 RepID=A0A0E9U1K2_ANGAN